MKQMPLFLNCKTNVDIHNYTQYDSTILHIKRKYLCTLLQTAAQMHTRLHITHSLHCPPFHNPSWCSFVNFLTIFPHVLWFYCAKYVNMISVLLT